MAAAAAFLALAILAASGFARASAKPLEWKAAPQALLRVDDHPVSEWNLYQVDKKNTRFLLRMNARFLFVNVTDHQIYELDPAKLEHKGDDIRWDPDDHPEKALETADWLVKDVGGAYRFRTRLVAENHVLDVQIPHPPDLRYIY